ncbi:MAG: hypothetical protein R3C59_16585 [Planctomycetaceae bacterium]
MTMQWSAHTQTSNKNRLIMAKKKVVRKPDVNKSQLIKEALAKNPNASPVEIADSLKEHGITPQYVSTTKFNMKKRGGITPGRRVGKTSFRKSEPTFTLSELVKASKLAEELGGVQKAQELFGALSKLN